MAEQVIRQPSHTCAACDHLEYASFCGFLIAGCDLQVRKPWAIMKEEDHERVGQVATLCGHSCKKWSGEKAFALLNKVTHADGVPTPTSAIH